MSDERETCRGVWTRARSATALVDQIETSSAAARDDRQRVPALWIPLAASHRISAPLRTKSVPAARLRLYRRTGGLLTSLGNTVNIDVPGTLTTIPVTAYCKRLWAAKGRLWGRNVKLAEGNSGAVNPNWVNRYGKRNTAQPQQFGKLVCECFLLYRRCGPHVCENQVVVACSARRHRRRASGTGVLDAGRSRSSHG